MPKIHLSKIRVAFFLLFSSFLVLLTATSFSSVAKAQEDPIDIGLTPDAINILPTELPSDGDEISKTDTTPTPIETPISENSDIQTESSDVIPNIAPPLDDRGNEFSANLISDPQTPDFTETENTPHPWTIRSVSSMKESKDRVCNQRDPEFIEKWVETAASLNLTHISLETPYDNPTCGDSVEYTKIWVDAIRRHNLHIWHRHMPLSFEGIYDTKKDSQYDYLTQIAAYITSNPSYFQTGDIFTPNPEPQNGGIYGVTHCREDICMFLSPLHFNQWLRDAIDISNEAFNDSNIAGVKIGYYGFDGFVAWGDNNPDWDGILEDETVAKMGNITIDHYPEAVGSTMAEDLDELQARYPNVPIIIGEWGAIAGANLEEQVTTTMTAANRPYVIGFNYWHLGFGGNESLILEDFSKNIHFDEVELFFK